MTRSRTVYGTLAVLLTAAPIAAGDVEVDVYKRYRAPRETLSGDTVNAYVVHARAIYPYAIDRVLDAFHDRIHVSKQLSDIDREEVVDLQCTRDHCTMGLQVVIQDFGALELGYAMEASVDRRTDGRVVMKWKKVKGTPIVRHLSGRMELRRLGPKRTEVDYRTAVGATLLTLDRLAAKTANYLGVVGDVLAEDHQGCASLWQALGPEQPVPDGGD